MEECSDTFSTLCELVDLVFLTTLINMISFLRRLNTMSLQVAVESFYNLIIKLNISDLVNHLVNLQQKSHHQSSINGVSNHISRENHSTNCNNADKKYPGNYTLNIETESCPKCLLGLTNLMMYGTMHFQSTRIRTKVNLAL